MGSRAWLVESGPEKGKKGLVNVEAGEKGIFMLSWSSSSKIGLSKEIREVEPLHSDWERRYEGA